MKRKFAAFDIDGTIGRSSIFLDVVHELLNTNHLPAETRNKLLEFRQDYKNRTHSNAFKDYSKYSVDVLFNNIANLSVETYRSAVDAVLERTKSYVHVYTRDLLKQLKSENYFLIAISGSEMYAVQQFTSQFEFDLAIGEIYHEKNGKFTGKIDQVFHKKGEFIKGFIEEHDLTLEGSIAVGDSMGDLSMLDIVETPIAFNPEDSLYNHARQNGWKIVVERKNVIYELEPKNGHFILA
jgi:HAD superfamily hydrolase (TIGR01490 family)